MDRRVLILIVVAGIAIALVSAFANEIGIGSQTDEFGWKQTVGLVVGVLLALGGVAMLMRRPPPAA
jgi:nitrate reductase gamma subunit